MDVDVGVVHTVVGPVGSHSRGVVRSGVGRRGSVPSAPRLVEKGVRTVEPVVSQGRRDGTGSSEGLDLVGRPRDAPDGRRPTETRPPGSVAPLVAPPVAPGGYSHRGSTSYSFGHPLPSPLGPSFSPRSHSISYFLWFPPHGPTSASGSVTPWDLYFRPLSPTSPGTPPVLRVGVLGETG